VECLQDLKVCLTLPMQPVAHITGECKKADPDHKLSQAVCCYPAGREGSGYPDLRLHHTF
jgi:hypothetical protein